MTAPTLETLSRHRGHRPLCFHEGSLFTARGQAIWRWDDLSSPEPRRVGRLRGSQLRRSLSAFRPLQRLLRLGVSHLAISESGERLALLDREFFLAGSESEPFRSLGRLRDPARRPMRHGVEAAGEGDFHVSEYFSNPTRQPLSLLRVGSAGVEPALRFAANEVRHVHLVQRDPWSDRTWFATGDYGPECRIGFTTDGFESTELIGSGDQSWRAACLLFTETAVLWGMDSPWEQASIVRWDRATGKRSFLAAAENPIWHGVTNEAGWLAFATTVEPSQSGSTRAEILLGRDDGGFTSVVSFSKDRWPMRLFQYGMLSFPIGPAPGALLVFAGSGLAGCDDTMFVARVRD